MSRARLRRSSSMGQSADLLRPPNRVFNAVPMRPTEQEAGTSRNPPKEAVAPPPRTTKKEQPPPTVVAEKPRKSIFTFPSPPRVEKPRTANDPYFLDACALCKKKTDFKQDICMYGDFQAFCSPECRNDQIALDEKLVRVKETGLIRKLNGHWNTRF